MSVHKELRDRLINDATLAALVGSRVYPVRLPQAPTLPAVTYQRASTRFVGSHGGTDGLGVVRYQLTAFADTYEEASAVAEAVRLAIEGWSDPSGGVDRVQAAIPTNQVDLIDPETDRYMIPLDVMIWAAVAA